MEIWTHRRSRRYRMPRNRKRKNRNSQLKLEQLSERVRNLTTDPRVTSDPKVKALLANIQGAKTTKEALEYHLLLDKFLFQERSLIEDPRRRGELARLQETAEGDRKSTRLKSS